MDKQPITIVVASERTGPPHADTATRKRAGRVNAKRVQILLIEIRDVVRHVSNEFECSICRRPAHAKLVIDPRVNTRHVTGGWHTAGKPFDFERVGDFEPRVVNGTEASEKILVLPVLKITGHSFGFRIVQNRNSIAKPLTLI